MESAPVRAGPRPFCKRCRTFKGKSRPPGGGVIGCKRFSWLRGVGCGFRRPLSMEDRAAIGAGLESGLCQARIARTLGRSPPRAHRAPGWGGRRSGRAQTPSRAPRPPGRRESHRGTLAALGQVSPHWGRLLTCPNAPFPTPMTRRLPQCTVLPAPMQSSPVQDHTTTVKHPPEPTPTASLTRPGPNRTVPAVLRQEPTEPSITMQPPHPLPSTCRALGFAGSGASHLPSCLVVARGSLLVVGDAVQR